LGHGKFEDFKEPVLLPSEVKGALVSFKPQGNVFQERMKSLQKRNVLQPKSVKRQKQLKNTLKYKVVDKRESREFLEKEMSKIKKRKGRETMTE